MQKKHQGQKNNNMTIKLKNTHQQSKPHSVTKCHQPIGRGGAIQVHRTFYWGGRCVPAGRGLHSDRCNKWPPALWLARNVPGQQQQLRFRPGGSGPRDTRHPARCAAELPIGSTPGRRPSLDKTRPHGASPEPNLICIETIGGEWF